MNRSIKSLARAYQDRELNDEEAKKLDHLLRTDAKAREVFLQETNLIAGIEDLASDEIPSDEIPSDEIPSDEIPSDENSSVDIPGSPLAKNAIQNALADRHPAQARRRSVTMAAGWIVAAALLLAAFFFLPNPERKRATIASVADLSGPLQWTGDGGRVRSDLSVGMRLSGGTIDGLSPESRVSLKFDDGSTVIISGNSMLAFSDIGQKVRHLKAGNLSADVSPQPAGRPMLIHTRAALLEVIGTSFDIDTDLDATALNVTDGRVRVKRLSDGRQVEVPAMHQVVAAADQALSVSRVPNVASQWQSRLGEGARRTYGRWLPATDGKGPRLRCIPYMTEDQRTIYTSSFQVTTADTAPVVTTDRAVVVVEGQLERATDLFVGMSLQTKDGEFAGRFQCVVPAGELVGQDEFRVVLPIAEFTLDPSLNAIKSRLAKSPEDLVVQSLWCHTLYQPAGLAVASIEISLAEDITLAKDAERTP